MIGFTAMKITDEARRLRSEVSKLRPDNRRRYGEELRARILDWVARVEAGGGSAIECSRFLGIKKWRFQMWRFGVAGVEPDPDPTSLVPIEIADTSAPRSLVLISRSGYRIEGLSMEQVIVVLREVA